MEGRSCCGDEKDVRGALPRIYMDVADLFIDRELARVVAVF
jgi:hypothetical protein